MAPQALKIGVFFEGVQAMDIIGIDTILNCSRENYEENVELGLAKEWLEIAPSMKVHWIAGSLQPTLMSSGMRLTPTDTYETAPKDLDILLIGGNLPSARSEASLQYLRDTVGQGRVKIVMTTCIGSTWLADSGVAEGRTMTATRDFLELAKQRSPGVKWLDQRWVVDGNFWTSAGAHSGIDMIGVYVTQTFPKPLANQSLRVLDLEPLSRGQFYSGPIAPPETPL